MNLINEFPFSADYFTTTKITSPFGPRPNPFNDGVIEFHSGIDLANKAGAVVEAWTELTVESFGYDSAKGNYVIFIDANKFRTLLGHLSINDKSKTSYDKGDLIGTLDGSGLQTGQHIHYEMLEG